MSCVGRPARSRQRSDLASTESAGPLPAIEELPAALIAFLVEAKRYMRDKRVGSLTVKFREGGVPTLVEKLEQELFPT